MVKAMLLSKLFADAIYFIQAVAYLVMKTCTLVFCKLYSFRPNSLSTVCDFPQLSGLIFPRHLEVFPYMVKLLSAGFTVVKV